MYPDEIIYKMSLRCVKYKLIAFMFNRAIEGGGGGGVYDSRLHADTIIYICVDGGG